MRAIMLAIVCSAMTACGSTERPTPGVSDGTSQENYGQAPGSFYPTAQSDNNNCVGSGCTQTIGSPILQLVNMQVEYIYAEDSVRTEISSSDNPTWQAVQVIPGTQIIPNICNPNGGTVVRIQFHSPKKIGTYTDKDVTRVIGFKEGNSFYVGTDDEGNKLKQDSYLNINDEIMKFTCDGGAEFAFESLQLNPRINLKKWLEGDRTNIF